MNKKPLPPSQNLRMKCPTGHIPYQTQEAAQRACDEHVRDARRHGLEGKSWRRLNTYKCYKCRMWHVGHSKQRLMEKIEEPLPVVVAQQTPEEKRLREIYMAKEARRHFVRAAERYRLLAKAGGPDAEYNDSMYHAMRMALRDFGQP